MFNVTSATNDRLAKISFFQEEAFTLFQSESNAAASKQGPVEALEQGLESHQPDKEHDTLTDCNIATRETKTKTKNALAIHYLTISFNNKEKLGYTENMRTTDWISVITCKVWRTLKTKLQGLENSGNQL